MTATNTHRVCNLLTGMDASATGRIEFDSAKPFTVNESPSSVATKLPNAA